MVLPELQPVIRESTPGIIARQLRAAIMSGSLPPGMQLGEAELAARFAVSRGPLREAMQRLVQEGLLRSERHRGLFVINLEPADVYDIYLARHAIEAAAARLIMHGDRLVTAALLDAVHEEMRDALARGDEQAIGDADVRFHQVFASASGSRRLAKMASTLLIETRMCISALRDTYDIPDDRVAEHGGIISAIRDGDEQLLLRLIDSHMEDGIRRLVPGYSLHGRGPGPALTARLADDADADGDAPASALGAAPVGPARSSARRRVSTTVAPSKVAGHTRAKDTKAGSTRTRKPKPDPDPR
jgi:DNA-binding GntR family transcriptional regulator